MPSGAAFVRTTAIVCGWQSSATKNAVRDPASPLARHSVIASPAAVASSRSDAFASGRPVRSATIVWKLSSASSRPCAISAWYGRVLRVPAGVLEDVAQDDGRRVRVVVAHADERAQHAVLRGERRPARRAPPARRRRAAARGRGRGGCRPARSAPTRASSESRPSAFSIAATSASLGPTWRRTKSAGGCEEGAPRARRSRKRSRTRASSGRSGERRSRRDGLLGLAVHEGLVRGRVHQRADAGRVGDPQPRSSRPRRAGPC